MPTITDDDLADDFRIIETFFKSAEDADLADETYTLCPLRAEQALARLRYHLALKDKALANCESTLQLCSERIASDSVAMNAIAKAYSAAKGDGKFAAVQKQQEQTDRYVFAAIDAARLAAKQTLSTNLTDAKTDE